MYAYLNGKFTHKSPAQVTVDVNGIGFELNISLNTYSAIQHLNDGLLYTYLQVKEDGHVLFGFFDKQEKEMFMLLISVSGVGASTARMMLSSMKADEISKAIVQGNVKLLESVKGIGKKTAERLVLELKDKVGKGTSASVSNKPAIVSIDEDALNAMVALGISKNVAEQTIHKIVSSEPQISSLEELIKKALRAI
jgi:Holliday junction DNA helicase RuvA